MFNISSIEKLEESLGYEQWMLSKAVDLHRSVSGYVHLRKTIIWDDGSQEVQLKIEDTLSLGNESKLLLEISPLLFISGFKILDMLMECIITENNGSCPWQFSQKKEILNNISINTILPYPLSEDPTIFDCLKNLYISFIDLRNALIHGSWGENISGNLAFNFQKDNKQKVVEDISFEQVIKFSDCMSICAKEVLKTSNPQRGNIIITMRWCLNELETIHQLGEYANSSVRYFEVVRHTKRIKHNFSIVDIKGIKEILDVDAFGLPYDYFLRVEAERDGGISIWEIPSNIIGELDELILDENWDDYRK